MTFLKKLFGQKSLASAKPPATPKTFMEKDNQGTRQDTLSKANAYWVVARPRNSKKAPFVVYTFDMEQAAREALLELPCIHLAQDSQQLICTEVLIFGYYRTEEGKYEAIICGDDLTYALWEQAGESFTKHGGRKKNDLEPERKAAAPSKAATKPGKVTFVREEQKRLSIGSISGTSTYRIHKGPDAATARAFLQEHPVTKPLYYIVVETPEGNYCRDKDGIYKEGA
jgi:hypothetical protein